MRFMIMVPASKESEAGVLPDKKIFAEMGKFNEEMVKAGVMLAAEGLHPTSKGARIKFSGGKTTVIDGPFTESKELIASYALFQVATMAEATEWTTRFLEVLGGGEVELRPVFEASDFPSDIFPPEEAAREEAWRQEMQRNAERQ